MTNKISIIGAGNVGATCAQRIADRNYADVVLMDIVPGLPQGKALDIMHSAPILNINCQVTGTNSYEETADSDVVVITSGLARKPGMSRDELLLANKKIISEVAENVAKYSPNCVIIVVTNPADAMTQLALDTSKFPRSRVLGLSGALDISRLKFCIANELKVPVESISAFILGQHGDSMVVIPRLCTVNGKPLTELLPAETIDKLVERTVKSGAEIVGLLKTGSAFYAPAAAVAQIVDAIMLENKETVFCSTYLDGEYGIKDTVLGVPVKLGRKGVEEIIEVELTEEEKAALLKSAGAVQELVKVIKQS
jgi:malate dehydrogenase